MGGAGRGERVTMTPLPPAGAHTRSDGAAYTILGVDDDPVVQILLSETFTDAGYTYQPALDSREAEQLIDEECYDLVLLDRRLPDSDGLLLVERIKSRCGCPVIILSSMNDTHDKLLGLGLGADDYITKPFSPVELCSRVANKLPGPPEHREDDLTKPIEIGEITFIPASRKLQLGDDVQVLPPAEAGLLHLLLKRSGTAVSRNDLTLAACDREWVHGDRTVDVLVSRLRRRLPTSLMEVVTVHRFGYMLLVT